MRRWRTVLVGLGKIGAGYADDPKMTGGQAVVCHAQALDAHARFEWIGAVDPDLAARARFARRWPHVPVAADMADLALPEPPEVLVLAGPPETRTPRVAAAAALKGLMLEKPVAANLDDAIALAAACAARGIVAQVNLWMRFDRSLRALGDGLAREIGVPRAIFGLYGNGLANNGTHLVDRLVAWLGLPAGVSALGPPRLDPGLPLRGDANVDFALHWPGGPLATVQTIDYAAYRELSLDLWGDRGRLCVQAQGLFVQSYPRVANRALSGAHEIAVDAPRALAGASGDAFPAAYDDLADALDGRKAPLCTLDAALATAKLVHTIRCAADNWSPPESAKP